MTNTPGPPNGTQAPAPIEAQARNVQWFNFGCMALVFGPFLLVGIVALLVALLKWSDLDWEERLVALILGGGFAAVGGLPFLSSQLNRGWIIGRLRLQKQYPGQPWMWRDDWAKGVIEDRTPGKIWGHWAGAAIVIAAFGVLYAQRGSMPAFEYYAQSYPVIFRLVLAATLALPAWVIVRAIHATLRRRRFSASKFLMSEVPCRLGGRLAGRLETPMQEIPPEGVGLSLSCLKITRSSSGSGGRSTHVTTVWSARHAVEPLRLGRGAGGVFVPVEFEVPEDGTPTGSEGAGLRFEWCLVATAELPGVDYRAEFDPPVFRVDAEGQVDKDTPNPM